MYTHFQFHGRKRNHTRAKSDPVTIFTPQANP